jgi:hypothetical protein
MNVLPVLSNNIINSERAGIAIFTMSKAIKENNIIDAASFCITLNSGSVHWARGSPVASISDSHHLPFVIFCHIFYNFSKFWKKVAPKVTPRYFLI